MKNQLNCKDKQSMKHPKQFNNDHDHVSNGHHTKQIFVLRFMSDN